MGFDSIFRNKLTRPTARPMLAGGGEQTIIWSADSSGLLTRVEALEAELARLRSEILAKEAYTSSDLDPDPNVDAATGYELASDGALRAYVEVSVEGRSLYEVALLAAPTVVYVAKDAKVAEAAPDTNYGTGNDLVAADEGSSSARRSWLQFDWGEYPDDLWALSPVLSVLRLYKTGVNDDEIGLSLKYEELDGDDWDESGGSGITWNSQPDIGGTISRTVNVEGTDYTFFDLTSLFFLLREAKSGEWDSEPYGLVVMAEREGEDVGVVDWKSREGAANDDQKPQLWYWEQAEKTQLMGGTVRTARFYGKPGGTYYLVHRLLDENNNPGRWSDPVEISLPSQGAMPSTPSAPTKEDTLISHLKTICLTTTVPADFSHFHVYVKETASSTVKEFNTRVDRFDYWFPFIYASGGGSYQVKYKIVTRSGAESAYSSNLSFSVTSNLQIKSPNGDNWLSLIDTYGLGATVLQMAGNVSDFIVSGDDGDYQVLTEKNKSVTMNSILNSCGQTSDNTSQNITGTTWAERSAITLTPPGSGNAYYLLIARCTVYKNSSTGIRLSFTVDSSATDSEEAWSSADVYETVSFMRRVGVSAGSSHTFKVVAKAADANTAIIGRSNFVALHLGNY